MVGAQQLRTQAFKNIVSYMGDRKSSKDAGGHVEKLAHLGLRATSDLRDELLVQVRAVPCVCVPRLHGSCEQVVKQITNNPDRVSTITGWKLLALLLGLFHPSQRLTPYLKAYLKYATEERIREGNARENAKR